MAVKLALLLAMVVSMVTTLQGASNSVGNNRRHSKRRRHLQQCQEGINAAGRQVQKIQVGLHTNGKPKYFCLTWLTPDPNPPNVPLGSTNYMLRMWNNTCGLYNWFLHHESPAGIKVAPHIHYGDEEWFILGGTGTLGVWFEQTNETNIPG